MQGNCFDQQDIERVTTTSYSYDDITSRSEVIPRALACDFGAGSSRTAIVICQLVDKRVQVIFAKQFEKPLLSSLLEDIVRLTNKHPNCRVYVDASNVFATTELKYLYRDWDARSYQENKNYVNDINQEFDSRVMVHPVNFLTTHKAMLT
jgi:hypothetical protein